MQGTFTQVKYAQRVKFLDRVLVEIYRPLLIDPKAARLDRVKKESSK